MNKLVKCYWILKGVGFRNVPRRLLQAWRIHSGYLANKLNPRRFSDYYFDREVSVTASEVRNAISGLFPNFVNIRLPDDDSGLFISKESSRRYLVERCERALEGQYLYFGSWYGNTGWPPDFNLDPKHCLHYPNNEFALKTAKSGPPGDDIKLVWESSRFSMAFYFARLYARTGDETWSEACWCMFDAWIAQCPPLNSVAWGCGQESTFRMMAILSAAAVTLKSASVTDERLMRLAKFIWQTGRLISYNINYALSQGNNHGISEAVGLLTAGLILSHFSRANQAERWIIRGKKYLIQEVNRQIYKDGSFVQNSMNYHRVMLDDLLWGLVLLKEEIPESVCRKIELATNWLAAFVNPLNGRVPNYGANDGAQVLPLSCCDYLDYRPVLQAAWFACYHKKFFESGPWDEKLHWLFNPERQEQDNASPSEDVVLRTPSCREFGAGGYYILRSKQSWGFTRCHTFKNRPGEPDMLHFDLWYQGRN
ncbi:MAG: hypothetical protein IKW74_02115, partial [Thermoguttaceae bacterium]|nr:hypothetical protein [Thermoguttaceae bacterium]